MTESAYPVAAFTGHEFRTTALPLTASEPRNHHNHDDASAPDGLLEDDGQISCVCGYADDDGWTVACDRCNKWQHQSCYYPEYEDRSLPEALEHYCIDCRPRELDRHAARERQRTRREEQASLANGIKRQAPKSHKKKIKDVGYTNGWPLDKSRHDRNSASPRDQPPPSKRPKTTHRASDSTTVSTIVKGHSRKRNASNVNHHRSVSRTPETPLDYYSEEFLRCCFDDQWVVTKTNLYNSIRVTNALSEWLSAPDDTFRDLHGHEKREVLMRWDGDLDDIPGKAQLDFQEQRDDAFGDDPPWKIVTVKEPVANGAYLGELKGHVGFKDEYQDDASNRWSLMRHPEPFVFFHPRLPIYIDARNEGTELRYVRRSCNPNARLQVLVTDSTDYRFCFMATNQIEPGVEVTIGWDTTEGIPELSRRGPNSISPKDLERLSSWVSTVLANCGSCACQLPPTDCLMSRFDRRRGPEYEDDAHPLKMPKAKRKKTGPHISPLNTHVNSRSGSEARRGDPDDDPSDSRSASGSAGRGSASRDITPHHFYPHNGTLSAVPELSQRERKKLAKEEEMFRRQEEERTGKQGKKKRSSAGSAMNTPSATSAKLMSLGGANLKYADAGTSKPTNLASGKLGKRPKSASVSKPPGRTITKIVPRPKPNYTDSEVQCDLEAEMAEMRLSLPSSSRRQYLSNSQRLLQRAAANNVRIKEGSTPRRSPDHAADGEDMEVDTLPQRIKSSTSPSPKDFRTASHPPALREQPIFTDSRPEAKVSETLEPARNAEMKDAAHEEPAATSSAQAELDTDAEARKESQPPQSDDAHPPSPPSAATHAQSQPSDPDQATQPHKPTSMHLQMPPPPFNPFAGATNPTSTSTTTPSSFLPGTTPTSATTGSALSQSPSALSAAAPPLFSPAVTAAVSTPSPARKKLSLSDYTRRSKVAKEHSDAPSSSLAGVVAAGGEKGEGDGAAASSSAAVDAKEGEGEEGGGGDVKMEDAPPPPFPASDPANAGA